MLPVLRVAAEGETRVPEAANRIAENLRLTDDEREQMLPSGRCTRAVCGDGCGTYFVGKQPRTDRRQRPDEGAFVPRVLSKRRSGSGSGGSKRTCRGSWHGCGCTDARRADRSRDLCLAWINALMAGKSDAEIDG
ncbi:winged helix-turn-helix domain-containing protein [Aurantimonas sp. C2-5-R2]